MDIYQNYREAKNMNNKYSGLTGSGSQIDSYILFTLRKRDNSQRIILDPAAYDASIRAAAADLAHQIQSYFK